MKVFCDTNVLVSAFATRGLCADLVQAILATHRLVVGETVLAEVERVLTLKMRVSPAGAARVVAFLRQESQVIGEAAPLTLELRDASDVAIVAEAVAGGADVLVTGDNDLLTAAAKVPIPIVSPRAFWEVLKKASAEA